MIYILNNKYIHLLINCKVFIIGFYLMNLLFSCRNNSKIKNIVKITKNPFSFIKIIRKNITNTNAEIDNSNDINNTNNTNEENIAIKDHKEKLL